MHKITRNGMLTLQGVIAGVSLLAGIRLLLWIGCKLLGVI